MILYWSCYGLSTHRIMSRDNQPLWSSHHPIHLPIHQSQSQSQSQSVTVSHSQSQPVSVSEEKKQMENIADSSFVSAIVSIIMLSSGPC